MIPVVWAVAFAHQLTHCVRIGAHNDARATGEILDGSAFLEEFRVGAHIEPVFHAARRQLGADRGADPVGGAHRHRGLIDDQLIAVQVPPDGGRHRQHILHVGGAILVRRRTHGDELQGAKSHAFGRIGGEAQAALFPVARH